MKQIKRPSGDLKKLLETDKAGSRLLGPIDKHLMTKPLDTDRRTDVLHPSEICSEEWCHRASYFLLKGELPTVPAKRNSAHLERIFEEGHAIHRKYQSWISDMGALWGTWRCLQCNARSWGQGPKERIACARCNGVVVEYSEVPVQSPRHRISGDADGWVLGLGDPFLIEIKSVGVGTLRFEAPNLLYDNDNDLEAAWKAIRRPFKKHRIQGQLYLALLELMEEQGNLVLPAGYARPEEIVFVYEYKPNQQSKEFVVGKDPEAVEDILEAALDLVYAIEQGNVPECNVREGGCPKCEVFE